MHVDCLFFARIKKGYYKSVLKSIPEANASIEIQNITVEKIYERFKIHTHNYRNSSELIFQSNYPVYPCNSGLCIQAAVMVIITAPIFEKTNITTYSIINRKQSGLINGFVYFINT